MHMNFAFFVPSYTFLTSTLIIFLLVTSIPLSTFDSVPPMIYGVYYILLWTVWSLPTENMISTMTPFLYLTLLTLFRQCPQLPTSLHLLHLFSPKGISYSLTLCSILTLDSCRLNVQYLAFLYPCLCLYLYVTPSIQNLLAYLYLYYLLRMCLVFVLLSIYFFKFSFYDCLVCLLICECLLCTINFQAIYAFAGHIEKLNLSPPKK